MLDSVFTLCSALNIYVQIKFYKMHGMIIDIKQKILIYKSVFEIIALFLKLPSLDLCPCYS